jgi:Domain of unknown function (DUF1707)
MERGGWDYPSDDILASDADRDQALSELRVAFRAGRLTSDELDQRSAEALDARRGRDIAALLADLPVERAPAPPEHALPGVQRPVAMRVAVLAAVAAPFFAVAAVGVALNRGPSLQQQQLLREMAASHGILIPPGYAQVPSFDWVGTATFGALAVLFVVLAMALRMRLARADRPEG